ncbi:hypothetical protein YPPY04_2916, partial [Yersinia pestis PY-04]
MTDNRHTVVPRAANLVRCPTNHVTKPTKAQ